MIYYDYYLKFDNEREAYKALTLCQGKDDQGNPVFVYPRDKDGKVIGAIDVDVHTTEEVKNFFGEPIAQLDPETGESYNLRHKTPGFHVNLRLDKFMLAVAAHKACLGVCRCDVDKGKMRKVSGSPPETPQRVWA